jgi:hypothetical protein
MATKNDGDGTINLQGSPREKALLEQALKEFRKRNQPKTPVRDRGPNTVPMGTVTKISTSTTARIKAATTSATIRQFPVKQAAVRRAAAAQQRRENTPTPKLRADQAARIAVLLEREVMERRAARTRAKRIGLVACALVVIAVAVPLAVSAFSAKPKPQTERPTSARVLQR